MGPFDPAELVSAYALPDRARVHLRTNFIASLDGAATHEGLSAGLNNEADKQVFDTLRMLADVLVVGAGTARIEGYGALRLPDADAAWRVAAGLPPHPALALVSRSLALDPAAPIFADTPVRPLVLTARSAPRERRAQLAAVAELVDCGAEQVEPGPLRAALAERGLPQILCEGGPQLLGALVAADAVDEFCLTLSPVLEGGAAGRIVRGGAQRTVPMRLLHTMAAGDMLFLRYARAAAS